MTGYLSSITGVFRSNGEKNEYWQSCWNLDNAWK